MSGIPALLKDVAEKPLHAGMAEAAKLLRKQVEAGRFKPEKAHEIQQTIRSALTYDGFNTVDIVVEAVVESLTIKQSVLAETEAAVRPRTVLVSNTSSLSLAEMSKVLKPARFCGDAFL